VELVFVELLTPRDVCVWSYQVASRNCEVGVPLTWPLPCYLLNNGSIGIDGDCDKKCLTSLSLDQGLKTRLDVTSLEKIALVNWLQPFFCK